MPRKTCGVHWEDEEDGRAVPQSIMFISIYYRPAWFQAHYLVLRQ